MESSTERTMMFKRELQVKMVKPKKSEPILADTTDSEYEGKAAIVAYTVDSGIKRVGWIVFGYVMLDAARKVAVALVTK
jgi:hypothetical protein